MVQILIFFYKIRQIYNIFNIKNVLIWTIFRKKIGKYFKILF